MSQFEFQTKEERDAWEVFRPAYLRLYDVTGGRVESFDRAAIRFDEREATCGILPLSEEHFALGCACSRHVHAREFDGEHSIYEFLVKNDLVRFSGAYNGYRGTDKGRAVLERLNAMCKVGE